jgi:hypothetical protein
MAKTARTESHPSEDERALLLAGETARQIEEQAGRVQGHPGPIALPWPKARPRYLVTVWLQEAGDQFECVRFDVAALKPGLSIGSSAMRDLPVGTLIRDAIHRLLGARLREAQQEATSRSLPKQVATSATGEVVSSFVGDADDVFLRKREAYFQQRASALQAQLATATGEGKGRRYPPGHLEDVARIVRDARTWQKPAAAAVAEAFNITKTAAANQISRARAQGLLEEEGQ